MVKRQNKKLLKKISSIALVIICGVLLVFGVSDSIFRTKVGVKGFEKELGAVSPWTRRALKSELDKIATLNSGKVSYEADYVLRDNSVQITENEETKESYATLYIDSEKLQLSLFVQLNWGAGLTETKEAYSVFISCADEANWQFQTNYCIAPQESMDYSKIPSENLLLLEDYHQEKANEVRRALTNYFLAITPKIQSLLLQRGSVTALDRALEADLVLDSRSKYHLKINSANEIILSKNNTEVWRYSLVDIKPATHHAFLIENYLPTELRTDNGTDFSLRWTGGNSLKILSDVCKDGDSDEKLINEAKNWLENTDFNSEDFKISMQKTCTK